MKENLIIKIKNLKKVYGKENKYSALKDINFEVKSGEFIGIMGASGSGKTTLLNILSTIDKPTSGEVEVEGNNILKMSQNQLADFRGKRIGFIFQDFNLLDNLTIYENIKLPLSLQGNTQNIKEKILRVTRKLKIDTLLNKYPQEISGGQKQRVAAARALINDPNILYGDEPTGALDSKTAKDFLDLLEALNQEEKTVLLVTHDPFSASYCKRILFIKDGEIENELLREDKTKEEFHKEILEKLVTY